MHFTEPIPACAQIIIIKTFSWKLDNTVKLWQYKALRQNKLQRTFFLGQTKLLPANIDKFLAIIARRSEKLHVELCLYANETGKFWVSKPKSGMQI